MIRKISSKLTAICIICLSIVSFMSINNVFADSWGGFTGSGSGGGGGGGYTNCARVSQSVRSNDCNGVSWIYYKYIGSNPGETVTFAPHAETGQSISGICAQPGYGFYHFGYNARFNGVTDPYSGDWLTNTNGYEGQVGSWLHVTAPTTTRINNGATIWGVSNEGVYHIILNSNGQPAYQATQFHTDSEVSGIFTGNPDFSAYGWRPNDLYAFCSTEDGTNLNKDIASRSKVAAPEASDYSGWDDSIRKTASGSYDETSVVFRHEIKLDNVASGDVNVNYTLSYTNSAGTVSRVSNNASGTATVASGSDTVSVPGGTYNVSVPFGQEVTICETITHPYKIKDSPGNSKSVACIKLKGSKPTTVCETSEGIGFPDGYDYAQITATDLNTGAKGETGMNGGVKAKDIWARPGDKIKYAYCLNPGAKILAESYGHGGAVNNTYRVSAFSTTGNSESYYFGNTINSLRAWSNINKSTAFASPSDDSTDYRCSINGYPSSQRGYYQIPGQLTADCPSSLKTKPSDVGSTIEQSLNWQPYHTHIKYVHQTCSSSWTDSKGNSHSYSYDCSYYTFDYARTDTGASGSSSASINIPYNYVLKPYLVNENYNAGGVVFGGQTMKVTGYIPMSPRSNSAVVGNPTYATISKPTKVKFSVHYDLNGGTYAWGPSKEQTVTVNPKGKLTGTDASETPSGFDPTFEFQVSDDSYGYRDGLGTWHDIDVGSQVCVDMTVDPIDSHNNENLSASAGNSGAALVSSGRNQKTYTVCNTFAKKPTMSVESSNAYANGIDARDGAGINTSIVPKTLGGGTYLFGSWSEYGVYGNVKFDNKSGMASGAALGYELSNGGTSTNAYRYNSGNVAKSPIAVCTFSTQTFANSNCANGQPYNSTDKANIGTASVDQFKSRIKDRFMSGDVTPITGLRCSTDINGQCFITRNGTKYANLSRTTEMNKRKDSNGITHLIYNENGGNAIYSAPVISCENITAGGIVSDDDYFTNMTNVAQVSGTLVLNGDIESGLCDGSDDDDPVMSNLGQITEQILIADKVYLTNNVKRVDAIIIANEVNTCAYNTVDDFSSGNKVTKSNLNSDMCNNSVVFNAPVITKKLVLARTAGAGHQNSSIQRAEIFNLRMDTYFWSYSQMQRYSQAVTTFSRELPVRY